MGSDFEKCTFIWSCFLHKGAGKNAKRTTLETSEIEDMIKGHQNYTNIKTLFEDTLSKKLFDSCLFQKKNCNIDIVENHYSPQNVLDIVSVEIKKLDISKDFIKSNLLDKNLHYNSTQDYPIEIIFALYLITRVCNKVNQISPT